MKITSDTPNLEHPQKASDTTKEMEKVHGNITRGEKRGKEKRTTSEKIP